MWICPQWLIASIIFAGDISITTPSSELDEDKYFKMIGYLRKQVACQILDIHFILDTNSFYVISRTTDTDEPFSWKQFMSQPPYRREKIAGGSLEIYFAQFKKIIITRKL